MGFDNDACVVFEDNGREVTMSGPTMDRYQMQEWYKENPQWVAEAVPPPRQSDDVLMTPEKTVSLRAEGEARPPPVLGFNDRPPLRPRSLLFDV